MVGLRSKVGEQPKILSFFRVNRVGKRGAEAKNSREGKERRECAECGESKQGAELKEANFSGNESLDSKSSNGALDSKSSKNSLDSRSSKESKDSKSSKESEDSKLSHTHSPSIHPLDSKEQHSNTQTKEEASTEWSCDRCTFRNQSNEKLCKICGFSRARYSQNESMIDALFKGKKPRTIPRCTVHGLPCVRHQVQKEGKNKGRFFYVCSLPIGFRNDPKAKCNYFQWEDSYIVCS